MFQSVEQQETLTELFGQNSVDEIEAVDERIWKRKQNRDVIEFGKDSITIDRDVYGRTFQDKQGILVSNHLGTVHFSFYFR